MATPDQFAEWSTRYLADAGEVAIVVGVLKGYGTPAALAIQRARDAVSDGLSRVNVRYANSPSTFDATATYGDFAKYATKAAINLARTVYGHQHQPNTVPFPDELHAREEADDERTDELKAAVAVLPATDRELLRLRYEEGWTLQEIAAEHGCHFTAVHRRLNRLHDRLREAVRARGGG